MPTAVDGLKKSLNQLLREPLVHFFAIGSLVFLFYGRAEPVATPLSSQTIIITDAQIAQLSATYEALWGRPPSEGERAVIIEEFLREEIYYREAIALGLDRDDTVIRRRLQQKMEFLGEAAVTALTPDEDTLRAHHATHAERFTIPARVTFQQLTVEDATSSEGVLHALAAGADPQAIGHTSLLPDAMQDAVQSVVDGAFGNGFFAQLEQLTAGEWQGPVFSTYGPHLVLVETFTTDLVVSFEAVHDFVLMDWRRDTVDALRDAHFEALRERYTVILPESEE